MPDTTPPPHPRQISVTFPGIESAGSACPPQTLSIALRRESSLVARFPPASAAPGARPQPNGLLQKIPRVSLVSGFSCRRNLENFTNCSLLQAQTPPRPACHRLSSTKSLLALPLLPAVSGIRAKGARLLRTISWPRPVKAAGSPVSAPLLPA